MGVNRRGFLGGLLGLAIAPIAKLAVGKTTKRDELPDAMKAEKERLDKNFNRYDEVGGSGSYVAEHLNCPIMGSGVIPRLEDYRWIGGLGPVSGWGFDIEGDAGVPELPPATPDPAAIMKALDLHWDDELHIWDSISDK